MKNDNGDVAKGLLRKTDSDLEAAGACLSAGQAFDAVCFHAQQAAEKAVKAYLAANNLEFPYIHSIEKLIALCAQHDPSFADIKELGKGLTPYAIEPRYDDDFWPSEETAREAVTAAVAIRDFVLERLPEGIS